FRGDVRVAGGEGELKALGRGVVGGPVGEVVHLTLGGLDDETQSRIPHAVDAGEALGDGKDDVGVGVEVVPANAGQEAQPLGDGQIVDRVHPGVEGSGG